MDAVLTAFMSVLRGFLRNERVSPDLTDEQWQELLCLAFGQSLSGVLWHTTEGCARPAAVSEKLTKDGYNTTIKAAAQEHELAALKAAFKAAEVTFLPIKGAVVRNYYPVPDLRTMGDLDIVVPATCRGRAEEAVAACGFSLVKWENGTGVYQKGLVQLELHDESAVTLFDRALQENVIFPDLWAHTSPGEDFEKTLTPLAEAAVLLGHFAKHLTGGGSGVRPLLDVAVTTMHRGAALDKAKLRAFLEPFGMTVFAKQIDLLCDKIFFGDTLQTDEQVLLWMSQLCKDGTFGTEERIWMARRRKNDRSDAGENSLKRWIFPHPAYLKRRFPYAGRHPFLLPVAWGNRLWLAATKHRKKHQARFSYAKEHREERAGDAAFFESIGL